METFSESQVLCEGNPPANSPHKDLWRGALMLSLICAWTNGWAKIQTPVILDTIALIMTSLQCDPGFRFNIKTLSYQNRDSHYTIRRSRDRLIFIMRIPILVRNHLYIESPHWFSRASDLTLHNSNNMCGNTQGTRPMSFRKLIPNVSNLNNIFSQWYFNT